MIEAKVICDSISPQRKRLTTFQLRYPKFIHGEFMTHRVFSRNASSSRAVPTAKLIAEVRDDALRAAPVFWGKNQPGMQAAEEVGTDPISHAKMLWGEAAISAANTAEQLADMNVHKQITNRLLEPFLHINVVCTATEYANFFGLRLDKAAQPEMQALAEGMWRAYGDSTPIPRDPGYWHLPYLDDADLERAYRRCRQDREAMDSLCCMVSAARCARVSYTTHEDPSRKPSFEEDLALYARLMGAQPFHASPTEHQATPDTAREVYGIPPGTNPAFVNPKLEKLPGWCHPEQHGNFIGWRQYRKTLPGEAVAPLPPEYA